MVFNLWAIVRTVQFWNLSLMVFWMRSSVSKSTAAVASSRMRTFVFLKSARAKQINCRWPTERFSPPSVTSCCRPAVRPIKWKYLNLLCGNFQNLQFVTDYYLTHLNDFRAFYKSSFFFWIRQFYTCQRNILSAPQTIHSSFSYKRWFLWMEIIVFYNFYYQHYPLISYIPNEMMIFIL